MKIARYLRRRLLHLATVTVVMIAVAGVGYDIKSTPATYIDSASVIFSLPKSETSPDAYEALIVPLITSSELVTQVMMSTQAQREIRAAGGTATVTMALVNLYDEEYPNYGVPMATLTSTSTNALASRRTFAIAVRRLEDSLTAMQARAGVRPGNRISAKIIAASGPIAQPGSRKRVYGGLAVLAIVAISTLWGMINRRAARRTRAAPVPPAFTRVLSGAAPKA
jgi:hypothetical protein